MDQRRVQVVQPLDGFGPLVIKTVVRAVKRHYIISSLWVSGLIVLTFFNGFLVPPERLQESHRIINNLDVDKLHMLGLRAFEAEERYRASKGWFTCDAQCQVNYKEWQAASKDLSQVEKEQEAVRRKARSVLGILSTFGVEEAKDLFWRSFRWGKRYGQRQTFWDLMFMGIRAMHRDESMMTYILNLLFHFLINMSIGLITAFFGFIFSLWGLIRSYQPDFFTGLLFFAIAAISAGAMVATYLVVLFTATIGTTVVGLRMVMSNANRLESGGQQGRRQRLPPQAYGYRPHYE